ncbi:MULTISPECIES: hypothetical protein [Nostocales]|uniref:Uncharacterized protein n=3 Tax=Nostocales TaxID=1161 RepID=A0A0C1RAD0_9CYAN
MNLNFQKILNSKLTHIILTHAFTLFIGFLSGAIFGGHLKSVSAIFGNDKKYFDFRVNQPFLNELDITGDWVYVAEANEKDILFSEDNCKKRFGTVYINQVFSTEINLTGQRRFKDSCTSKDDRVEQHSVRWRSLSGSVVLQRKNVSIWFSTEDDSPRYGYILLTVVNNPNTIKPTEMNGTMYYLNDQKKTWFRAKVDFYRSGSEKAKPIEKKW